MCENLKKSTTKIVTTIFLLLLLLPGFNVSASTNKPAAPPTNYVAIGDSISYGMSATDNAGYATLFYNYLKNTEKYQNLTFTNLSKPGDTSSDLLKKIRTKDVQAKLANADIITISIGGNNFLGPVVGAVGKLFGMENASGTKIQTTIMGELSSHPIETYYKLSKLLLPSDPAYKNLYTNLQAGTTTFISDWRSIVPEIKAVAPKATIYVNTVYNTFSKSDSFYKTLEKLLSGSGDTPGINTEIKALAPNNYKVVDAHDLYANYNGAYSLLTFSINKGNFDPHPTDAGHRIMFEALLTPVTSVSLDKTSQKLDINKTLQVTSKVLPIDATNPDITWSSSNKKVATVDDQGLITSKSKGKATIIATTKDGNKTASLVVTVKDPSNVNIFIITGIVLGLAILIIICYLAIKKAGRK